MKTRLFFLLRFYAACLLLFAVAKPLSMLFGGASERGMTAGDYWAALVHGASPDIAATACLAVLPWLGLLLSFFVKLPHGWLLWKIYSGFIAAAVSLILVGDACLYSLLGSKAGCTALHISLLRDVVQGVSWLYLTGFSLAVLIVALVFYQMLVRIVYDALSPADSLPLWKKLCGGVLFLLLGGLMFLSILGMQEKILGM